MNNIKKWCIENSEYLWGIGLIIIVCLAFFSIFSFSSVSMQEGWYQIYSKWIDNGMVPYKDFPLVVTPLSLLIYLFFYKILGLNLIAYHILGIISKISVLIAFFIFLSLVFPKRYAAIGTLFSGVILMSIIYDNGFFAYNDLILTFSSIIAIIFFKFVKKLETSAVGIYKYSFLIGVAIGITILCKQTFGGIMLFAFSILMTLFCLKLKSIKTTLKCLCSLAGGFISVVTVLITYLCANNMMIDFLNNTFLKSTSAKGNLTDLLLFHFKHIPTGNLLIYFYVTIFCLIFIYFLTKRFGSVEFKAKPLSDKVFYPVFLFFSMVAIYSGYNLVKIGFTHNHIGKMFFFNDIFVDLGIFPMMFVTIMAFYYFCKFVFDKEYNSKTGEYFTVFSFGLVLTYSMSLSTALPNLYTFNYALFTTVILSYTTIGNNIKNFLIYFSILFSMSIGATIKTICPCVWHSWQSESVAGELAESKEIPVLKGMKLPVDEVNAYDEIKRISDKYTTKDDKIFAYMNIQAFYYFLEREPLTTNISQFWDVCSDEMAEKDAEELIKNPPKLIVYMQFPMNIVGLHEDMFRQRKQAKQRIIDKNILKMMNDGKYVTVLEYSSYIPEYEKYINDKKILKQYKQYKKELNKLTGLMTYNNKADEINDYNNKYRFDDLMEKITEIEALIFLKEHFKYKRTFIPNDYNLKILVRKDVYNSKN